ncbi:hypothetical protein PIB30_077627 [Stylosanthes scabra]|uniref:Uncharacterized protein n=1 Tax=Stylosanthes scabra TaxID=79078 RepID=A0ABU6QRR2_9FABA|nr:hypothetical protein [Stylosanthes scabra]
MLRQLSKLEPVPEKSDNIRSENPQPMDSQYGRSAKPTVFILVGLLENRFRRGRIDSEGILNVNFENRVKTNRFGDPSNRLDLRRFMKFSMWSRLKALSNRFKRQVLKSLSLCQITNRFDVTLNRLD